MTGTQLDILVDEINGGAPIGSTLKFQLLNLAKSLVEGRRPWMLLRSTDTSKSVTTANTWQAAIDLSTITDFNRFFETETSAPIKLFDGSSRIEEYRQRPWNERLSYKDEPNTFVYDEANKLLYLNSSVAFGGTLYIDYIRTTPDLTNDDSSTWAFPSYSHPLLAFMAAGIHKGGIDFDEINARMAPDNRAMAELIVKQLENWDNEKALSAIQNIDPYSGESGYRSGAININA